jgi:hypothetical protein
VAPPGRGGRRMPLPGSIIVMRRLLEPLVFPTAVCPACRWYSQSTYRIPPARLCVSRGGRVSEGGVVCWGGHTHPLTQPNKRASTSSNVRPVTVP